MAGERPFQVEIRLKALIWGSGPEDAMGLAEAMSSAAVDGIGRQYGGEVAMQLPTPIIVTPLKLGDSQTN